MVRMRSKVRIWSFVLFTPALSVGRALSKFMKAEDDLPEIG